MPINGFLYPGAKFIPPYQVANSVRFNPRENMGVIFPSWLQHWVQTNNSEERVSISWNTLVKGHHGAAEGKANAYF